MISLSLINHEQTGKQQRVYYESPVGVSISNLQQTTTIGTGQQTEQTEDTHTQCTDLVWYYDLEDMHKMRRQSGENDSERKRERERDERIECAYVVEASERRSFELFQSPSYTGVSE